MTDEKTYLENGKVVFADNPEGLDVNEGYFIFARRVSNYDKEHKTRDFVFFGYNPTRKEYVTWVGRQGVAGYYNGHYSLDFDWAVKDYQKRY